MQLSRLCLVCTNIFVTLILLVIVSCILTVPTLAQEVRGDFNNDRVVNIVDHQLFLPHLQTSNSQYSLIGNDATVDLFDYNELLRLAKGSTTPQTNFVTTNGDHFLLNGQEWHPYGIRYVPRYYAELGSEDFLSKPLDSNRQQTIRQDLEEIKNLNLNTVSLIVWDSNATVLSNLQTFLSIAKEKNLRVAVMLVDCAVVIDNKVSLSHPDKCIALLNAIKDNPTVWVIETSWEEALRNSKNIVKLKDKWQEWLVNNYGSLASANALMGTNWSSAQAPNIDYLCQKNGDKQKLAINYRRFLIDYAAKLHTENYDFIKKYDNNHLISARAHGGNTGARSECKLVAISPLAKSPGHDFISTQFYQIGLDKNRIELRARVTSDYLHVGRPIIITEYGYSIFQPHRGGYFPSGLAEQQQYYEIAIPALKKAGIQGAFSWFYLGKRPWSSTDREQSDLGIIEPNTSQRPGSAQRPAASVIRNNGPFVPQTISMTNPTIYMDYFRYPNFTEVFEETVSELERDTSKQVRLDGTQYTSANVPIRCLTGDTVPTCPQRYLSSALVLEIQDRTGVWRKMTEGMTVEYTDHVKVRGRVANTGETTWITQSNNPLGLVQIGVKGSQEGRIPISDTNVRPFHNASVSEYTIPLPRNTVGLLEFQTLVEEKVWFGEIIRVKLSQVNP